MADVETAHEQHRTERRREANTMALYIGISLLAALTALPDSKPLHAHGLGVVWGITLGLALAHWFSFWVATRLVSAGKFAKEDVRLRDPDHRDRDRRAEELARRLLTAPCTMAPCLFPRRTCRPSA
jgi:hypothetical protein